MNDTALTELKIHVERAVRPVRVGLSRKRRMREELLSHLLSLFDEEFARLGDEQKAVDEARRRFGQPKEITDELQRGISWDDRLSFWVDRLRLEPGESLPHLLAKHLLFACMVYGVQVLLLFLLMIHQGHVEELGLALRIFAVVGVFMWLFGSLFVWMSNRISRALHGSDPERSWPTLTGYCLGVSSIFPLATVLTYWGLGILPPPPFAMWGSGIASLLLPAALILISRQAGIEIQHDDEWAFLEIGT